jgi:hypothetical protein
MSDSMLRIMCPNLLCRKVLTVPELARGKTVRCRSCSTAIRIPAKAEAEAGAPPADTGDPQAA